MDQRSKDLLERLHAIAVVQARRYAEILHELERLRPAVESTFRRSTSQQLQSARRPATNITAAACI